MSDNFSGQNNNTKLSNSTDNAYFNNLNNSDNIDDISLPYDHMYASSNSNENGIVNTSDTNCQSQSLESEVKFLKDWLVLHLDLIQQQNDEIISKERTIYYLQKENEMLKERISCIEHGTPFRSNKFVSNHKLPELFPKSFSEDMTQDLGSTEDNNDNTGLVDIKIASNTLEVIDCGADSKIHDTEIHVKLPNNINNKSIDSDTLQSTITYSKISNTSQTISDYLNISHSSTKYKDSYMIHNSVDTESMKNLKMSIRRKRLCSNSSAFSNNDSTSDEKRSYRRSRKKRKRIVKDEQILTSKEPYVTHTGEINLSIINPLDLPVEDTNISNATNLEVPRWRIKSYTSCYTMEGTENLDDDVYNRRHSRLEIDERRRKRWDVQRIREQRLIEKLKQRQEKAGAHSRSDDQSEPVQSLWPSVEDVKFIEICDNLPVSAFGCPIPKFQPSEFSLPWLNNPNNSIRRVATRKSRSRRRGTKR